MAKEYIVKTKADIHKVEEEQHIYVIQADSPEQAEEYSRKLFANEYRLSGEVVISTVLPYVRKNSVIIIACVLMAIAIFLSYRGWYTEKGHEKITFHPQLISVVISSTIYAAFVVKVKGLQETVASVLDIVMSMLNILLLSTFVELVLVEKVVQLKIIEFSINSLFLLIIAVLLAWLGNKAASTIVLLGIFLMAISQSYLRNK